jgi:hypothetical protein
MISSASFYQFVCLDFQLPFLQVHIRHLCISKERQCRQSHLCMSKNNFPASGKHLFFGFKKYFIFIFNCKIFIQPFIIQFSKFIFKFGFVCQNFNSIKLFLCFNLFALSCDAAIFFLIERVFKFAYYIHHIKTCFRERSLQRFRTGHDATSPNCFKIPYLVINIYSTYINIIC